MGQGMKRMVLSLIILTGSCGVLRAGVPATAAPDRIEIWDAWSVDAETGVLWRCSDSTTADYTVMPFVLSFRTPQHLSCRIGEGLLTVRARLSLLAEAMLEGPETAYLGFSASPSVEYWFGRGRRTCAYLSVGGGCGWVDSTGEPGGQGQDFTLNWFATACLRRVMGGGWSVHGGVMFQHLSNGGATDPNPGLDAIGPVVGCGRAF